jgi:hypothetical protein
MLAMDQRTPRAPRPPVSSLTTIASKLAPTGQGFRHCSWDISELSRRGYSALRRCLQLLQNPPACAL